MRQNLTLSGRYRLDARLGRGGMGEVWRATDLRLGRSVAVKLLPLDQVDDPQAMRRFEREATAAAALRHRGITVVFDSGADDESELVFIVMELLDGEDLQRLLARTPGGLPPEQVREFGAQIASALAAAHEQGVVHRDVKPANVILLPDGDLKICDFGIARIAAHSGSLTQGMIGTPSYMAPEQLRGEAIDGRTDLYSFGCLLYALASGRPPFTVDTLPALMYHHMSVAPQPLTELRPGFPAGLADLVMRCLAKDPRDRPGSARELSDALLRADMPETRPSTFRAPAVPPQTPPPMFPGGPPVQGVTHPVGASRSLPKIAIAAAVGLAAVVAASAATYALTSGNGGDARAALPTPAPTASTTAPNAPSAPASVPATAPRPAHVPDGWIQHDPDDYQTPDCPSSGTGYLLDVDPEPGYVKFCDISVSRFENVAISTDVVLSGSRCASLVVRRREPFSYEFVLCADGSTFTRKWFTGDDVVVLEERPGGTPLNGKVRLTAVATDDTLAFYVNGALLTRPKDSEIQAGGVALGASVLASSKKSTMPFTDLTVWCAPGADGCA
ncbi:serine/threonine-protein kinase [Actinocorallia aurantiaca]|uniref:non-specific serine/threonine protein kinase n=1 Tax=Actinocorallia aurantiaca TaxID=46204 RepID=A0ABP6GK34_9ACTN